MPETETTHTQVAAQLALLSDLGVSVTPTRRGTLRVKGAPLLSPGQLRWLRENKDAVLSYLSAASKVTEIRDEPEPSDEVVPDRYQRPICKQHGGQWTYADICTCPIDPHRPDWCKHVGERRRLRDLAKRRRREGRLAHYDMRGIPRDPDMRDIYKGRMKFARRFGLRFDGPTTGSSSSYR